ncbi:PAS domain-containing protein [uncultured Roseibium sp.]|uniref:PAS domain-containing sensor histidine kinase n=1 Tax=uncultured Roseibium sp. TaxID=1936171 RepID=UPI0026334BD1|nr:PAS domain-containing protein [uncultured Roseibium sp.]
MTDGDMRVGGSLAPQTQAMLNILPVAIYATDVSGLLTYFNETAVEFWGDRPQLGHARWCGSFRIYDTDGRVVPLDQCPMAQCLTDGRAQNDIELVIERPDGSCRSVIVNPRPMYDDAGAMIGALNTIADVTAVRQAEQNRSRSESFARQVLEQSQDCIKLLDLDGRLQSINPCGVEALEISDPQSAVGLSYFDFWEGEDREASIAATRQALEEGQGRFSATFTSSTGRMTRWDEIISPRTDERGEMIGYLVVSRDISAREQATRELEERLRQQKAIAELSAMALRDETLETTLNLIVEKISEVLHCPLVKVLKLVPEADGLLLSNGVGWQDGLVGTATVDIDEGSQAGFTLLSKDTVVVDDLLAETRFSGPDLLIAHGVRGGISATIAGLGSRPYGVLGVHTTVCRKFGPSEVEFVASAANIIASRFRLAESEERRRLIIREMAHRTGNLMQLVSSIFEQTIRSTTDIEDAKKSFGNRLGAMARVNNRVVSDGWKSTRLVELVSETLSPFEGSFDLNGRDIVLPSDLCFDLGLVLHELATNSAKYGAFSSPSERVKVNWSIADGEDGKTLTIDWVDPGGSTAVASTGTGFGSKLVTSLVKIKWRGKLSIELGEAYRCTMEIPIAAQDGLETGQSWAVQVAAE